MSRPWMPSNGTEFSMFHHNVCGGCVNHSSCFIVDRAMMGIQPSQWTQADGEYPTCSSRRTSARRTKRPDTTTGDLFAQEGR